MSDFTLTLKTPVIWDGIQRFVADLTPDPRRRTELQAIGWRRSIRAIGGFWLGDFELVSESDATLSRFFYEYLGYHLQEMTGGHITWEGMIYEMEFTSGGSTKRRSFDHMLNALLTIWADDEGEVHPTDGAWDYESIRRHGERNEMLYLDDGATIEAAEALRDSTLREMAWPWARPVGLDARRPGPARLRVQIAGYIFTGNWRYLSVGDGSTGAVSDYIRLILTAHFPFIKSGNIQENNIPVVQRVKIAQRAWDAIVRFLELGDEEQQPMRAYVDIDRRFHYETIKTRPEYFWREGALYSSPGSQVSVHPRTVRPAVVRDLSYPVKKSEIGAWLQDARDTYIQEVEVLADGQLVLKTDLYEESEIQAAQENYKRILERELRENAPAPG